MDMQDVVVVGGGAAGLAAALTLVRARRSVLVVDAGEPRNAPADAVHGYLGRDGVPPGELLDIGRREVEGYGGRVLLGRVTAASRSDDGFVVDIEGAAPVRARRLLLATGLVDELPAVPGLRERWGRDVLHCPYCHGWEVRDRTIGVLATGPMTMHMALLMGQWSSDLTLFRHTGFALTDEEREQLGARRVRVVDGEVTALAVADDRLRGLRLRSGEVVACEALVVTPRYLARDVPGLGVELAEHPAGIGQRVGADPATLQVAPGVWAAGNVDNLMAQVGNAAADGVRAAIAINSDLVAEDVRRAVDASRSVSAAR
ncbi:NAD(P)/FAD-dependent oxidoreductase [Pseudonocardia sp. TRM90224]|uniref:NAD(P)/FAD-dependent oxidoreductase n=1 Tax=Pseudonocardia sp. TRM90224 TaxID=2812678 RepID=UPI001E3C9CD6|nr:NAD(P)/FAD-dependent oxidoreductase [Pseudonocardia sp. TRM90224]